MPRTRADTEAQVADDLARADLTTQITAAGNWALQYYQDDRFWFNEVTHASVTLSASLDYLDLTQPPMPYRFQQIDRMRVELNGVYYELLARDYNSLMAWQDNRTFSRPGEYCVYNNRIQFDVGTDANYTLNIDGLIQLGSAASASFSAADTSEWFNAANELIRSAIKRSIYGHILKDDRMASMAVEAEQDAYSMLKGRTTRLKATGKVRPVYF